jgi:hypothetical protein
MTAFEQSADYSNPPHLTRDDNSLLLIVSAVVAGAAIFAFFRAFADLTSPLASSSSDSINIWAYTIRTLQGIHRFLGAPDCANYFIFVGYLAFMWGIVGLANYFDIVNADGRLRGDRKEAI